jgi:hypothetical protein|tara:strand:+ start:578 stop:853 length:276 start_codon:yes stop_codon:yes gene_type:complete
MSETVKFTKEELDDITKIRDGYKSKINDFGRLELDILLTTQRLEALAINKEQLQKDYVALQKKETEFVDELNKKYGPGSVDIRNGEFTPAK